MEQYRKDLLVIKLIKQKRDDLIDVYIFIYISCLSFYWLIAKLRRFSYLLLLIKLKILSFIKM